MSNAREVIGEVVQDQRTEDRARVPVDNLNLSWVYAHFPMAWEYKGGRWLPELSQISFRKGLNGSAEDGNTSAPKAHVVSKGGTIIEPGNARLGKYKNYLRRLPAFSAQSKQTGSYYASMFESSTVIGNRHARWTLDTQGYDDFRAFLVTKGIIEDIDVTVIEAKIDEKQGLLDHLKNLPQNQLRTERITQLEKLIDEMRASVEGAEKRADAQAVEAEDDFEPEEDAIASLLDEASAAPAPRRKPGRGN